YDRFSALYETCFPVLRAEWELLKSVENVVSAEESHTRMLEVEFKGFIGHLFDTNFKGANAKILIYTFWMLLEAFITTTPEDVSLDNNAQWVYTLQDLFVFFANQPKHVFKKHLQYLVTKCKMSPVQLLSKFITEE
ncbi:unnamed protein product, partial [Ilex paraguariensis]